MESPDCVDFEFQNSFIDSNVNLSSSPLNPLSFEDPIIHRGDMITESTVLVFDPEYNMYRSLSNVLISYGTCRGNHKGGQPIEAYWFKNVIRQAIYGSVVNAELLVPCLNETGCSWQRTGEEVAIKVIDLSKFDNVCSKGSIRNAEDPLKEIAAMQHIVSQGKYENVLTLKDAIVDDKYLYIVMPYCKGGELFDLATQNEGGFSESMVKGLMRQILTGLKNLHDAGVCHRDMSLENVLLDEDGTCRIIDFGLCLRVPQHKECNFSPLIKAQGMCGKWFYMAPEVFEDKDFNPYAIDVWSCGMMMFMLLTSSPAYDQPRMSDEGFRCIASGNLSAMIQAWGFNISPGAINLLNGMLCVDPEYRMTLDEIINHPWFQNE
jgi:serine/threonine protein kinase